MHAQHAAEVHVYDFYCKTTLPISFPFTKTGKMKEPEKRPDKTFDVFEPFFCKTVMTIETKKE